MWKIFHIYINHEEIEGVSISDFKLSNVDQPITTKLEVVYNVLRENIVNGNLKPGTRLIIRRIAQDLGVSEIPVREAIRSLEAQGLVTMTPHSGAQVTKLDEDDIKEIMEVRSILEGYAARLAVPLSPEILDRLRVCMNEMRECVARGEYAQFGIINRKFHKIIYEQAANKRLKKLLNEMFNESERSRAVFGLSQKRSEQALKEHEAIMATLISGDGEKVEELIRIHRQRASQELINCLVTDESK